MVHLSLRTGATSFSEFCNYKQFFFQSGTLLVVPGICNHAENTYVKAFSQHMMSLGFQVVVFNHTGALKSVKLNRGKIFTYGE